MNQRRKFKIRRSKQIRKEKLLKRIQKKKAT